MNERLVYRVSGLLSIAVGIGATLCIFKIQNMFYGVGLSIIGFILSGVNIFLNAKNEYEGEKFPKGYLGMFLSSLPIIFMMLIIFKFRK
jgi:hypothetical protein